MEFVYALPAPTTFASFEVPSVGETPSPSQTFTQRVEVFGAVQWPSDDSMQLAAVDLAPHEARGEVTTFAATNSTAVSVVIVRLSGGIEAGATFFEFSELIGRGTQEPVAMVDHFTGVWTAPGGGATLRQSGPTVTGCLDRDRKSLEGTVAGNLLFATFADDTSGVGGALVAAIGPDRQLRAVRSDNGAPFRLYEGEPADRSQGHTCAASGSAAPGCGDVIHGIQFAFDSDRILDSSAGVLDALADGLRDGEGVVTIEGHTSSEGAEDYNLDLSRRRAQAVVTALGARGIDASRLQASGRGEAEPMADESTEIGRALNRRVEVHCADASP